MLNKFTRRFKNISEDVPLKINLKSNCDHLDITCYFSYQLHQVNYTNPHVIAVTLLVTVVFVPRNINQTEISIKPVPVLAMHKSIIKINSKRIHITLPLITNGFNVDIWTEQPEIVLSLHL